MKTATKITITKNTATFFQNVQKIFFYFMYYDYLTSIQCSVQM